MAAQSLSIKILTWFFLALMLVLPATSLYIVSNGSDYKADQLQEDQFRCSTPRPVERSGAKDSSFTNSKGGGCVDSDNNSKSSGSCAQRYGTSASCDNLCDGCKKWSGDNQCTTWACESDCKWPWACKSNCKRDCGYCQYSCTWNCKSSCKWQWNHNDKRDCENCSWNCKLLCGDRLWEYYCCYSNSFGGSSAVTVSVRR